MELAALYSAPHQASSQPPVSLDRVTTVVLNPGIVLENIATQHIDKSSWLDFHRQSFHATDSNAIHTLFCAEITPSYNIQKGQLSLQLDSMNYPTLCVNGVAKASHHTTFDSINYTHGKMKERIEHTSLMQSPYNIINVDNEEDQYNSLPQDKCSLSKINISIVSNITACKYGPQAPCNESLRAPCKEGSPKPYKDGLHTPCRAAPRVCPLGGLVCPLGGQPWPPGCGACGWDPPLHNRDWHTLVGVLSRAHNLWHAGYNYLAVDCYWTEYASQFTIS